MLVTASQVDRQLSRPKLRTQLGPGGTADAVRAYQRGRRTGVAAPARWPAARAPQASVAAGRANRHRAGELPHLADGSLHLALGALGIRYGTTQLALDLPCLGLGSPYGARRAEVLTRLTGQPSLRTPLNGLPSDLTSMMRPVAELRFA